MARSRTVFYFLGGLAFALALAGCGGGGGIFNPNNPSNPSNPSFPSNPSTPPPIKIFVSDVGLSSNDAGPDVIDVFPSNIGSGGSFSATIANSSMTTAFGLAAFNGNLYVANQGQGSAAPAAVFVFPKTANGNNVTPLAKISGTNTGFSSPYGVAVDGNGNIFVADPTGGPNATGAIDVFSPGANGNVAPFRQITGINTQLSQPYGVAVDSSGNVFVANDAGAGASSQLGDVVEFSPGAGGNVAPAAVYGRGTLNGPVGIALDASDDILVSCEQGNSVVEFTQGSPSSAGQLGPSEGIQQPQGLAIDGSGFLYVVNQNINNVSGNGPNVSVYGASPSSPVLVFGGISSGGSTFIAPSGIAL